jgi:hypothetical protein
MNDTPPEIERAVRERIMARSPQERFRMGAEMFDAAVTLILASLPPGLPEAERKERLFHRLYGLKATAHLRHLWGATGSRTAVR